jgi:hypothetical protein
LAAVVIVVATGGGDQAEDGQHREDPQRALAYRHMFPLMSPSNAGPYDGGREQNANVAPSA